MDKYYTVDSDVYVTDEYGNGFLFASLKSLKEATKIANKLNEKVIVEDYEDHSIKIRRFGSIQVTDAVLEHDGCEVVIVSKNGQGWGLPTCDLDPESLRDFAHFLERRRKILALEKNNND